MSLGLLTYNYRSRGEEVEQRAVSDGQAHVAPVLRGAVVGDMGPCTGLESGVKILGNRVDDDSAEDSGEEFWGVGLVGFLFDGGLPS